ncbi:MAG: hypothetical protein AAFU60_02035 [Bacteroidota bacterium]
MMLQDVIGQHSIKQSLLQLVESERLPHAMLLLGPEGAGGLPLAIGFGQYLLCTDRQPDGPCGRCSNCLKSEKLIHPDLHFSFPTVGSKVTSDQLLSEWRTTLQAQPYMGLNDWMQVLGGENKQGNINKEECNRIIRSLSFKTFEGAYKVLIMWMPELLGKEGNRLLKLIEEPPPQTVIILVAEQAELILNTILSRCQMIKFRGIQDTDIAAGLVRQKGLAEQDAMMLAQLADGSFQEAIHLAENAQSDQAEQFIQWLRHCYQGNGPTLVQDAERLADLGRESLKHFMLYGLHFLQELFHLQVAGDQMIRLRPAEQKVAQNMQKVIGFEQLQKMVSLLNDAYHHITRNAHPKLLLLNMGISIHKILRYSNR